VLVNKEVGFWLARILYTHNPAKSDSAKIPGMMELLRVQVSGGGTCGSFCLRWDRCCYSGETATSPQAMLAIQHRLS
jgi:hypothetical protein